MSSFVFANPKLCIGCDTCLAACAEVHKAVGLQPQPRLSISRSGQVSTPMTCRHCENAPCITVCSVNAITMGDNSVVLDEAICNGCKLCADVCPFGIITLSDVSAKPATNHQDQIEGTCEGGDFVPNSLVSSGVVVDTVAVKCDLCDFSKNGPECVRVCPTDALFLIDAKSLRRSSNAKRKAATQNMPLMMNNFMEKKT